MDAAYPAPPGCRSLARRGPAPRAVNDSVQDLRNAGLADGRPAVMLLIRRQPGANIVERQFARLMLGYEHTLR